MAEMSRSARGFLQGNRINGTYPDTWVRAYESSAADEPCIWVATGKSIGETYDSEPVHLTLADAKRLRRQLGHLIKNHYQLGLDQSDV